MNRTKQLIINCGASRVTAAVVSSDGSGLRIEKLVGESIDYELPNDDAWLKGLSGALRELRTKHKLSGKASFIIRAIKS